MAAVCGLLAFARGDEIRCDRKPGTFVRCGVGGWMHRSFGRVRAMVCPLGDYVIEEGAGG